MAIENLNNENMPHASTSLPQRSDEHGFNLSINDLAYPDGVASDRQHNDRLISLPVVSTSPPHLNVSRISQYHNRDIVPTRGNFMTNSSQINNSNNFEMFHHLPEGDHRSLIDRPNSDFSYQHAPFNLNSSEKLDDYREVAIDDNSFDGRPQVLKPIAKSMDSNIGQPPLDLNFGMPMFSTNQGAVSSNCPEQLEEKYFTFGSESNTNAKINTSIFGVNIAGNSKREFIPPIGTRHSKMDSRSFLHPDFDMNTVVPSSQNNNEVIYNLPQNVDARPHYTDNHKVMPDVRPDVRLGPSYDFQRPPTDDQIHRLKSVNPDLRLGGRKDIGMDIANLSHKDGFERCMGLSSLPLDSNQIMQRDIGYSKASERVVFSSPGTVSNQPLSGQLPEFRANSNGKFSLQSSTSPPMRVATGGTSGLHPSNLGMQTGMRNITAQVSRPCVRSSLKRGASEPQSSLTQAHRRKSLVNQPFIHPSIPTWSRSAPLVPNTTQTISRSAHNAISLTPPGMGSAVHPSISTWTKTALSAPNISQTIPPLIRPAPSLPPQACASMPLPHHDKRIPSFLPGSQIKSLLHQPQIAQSLPHRRWRPPVVPSTPKIVPTLVKYKDETPKLIGQKCLLCMRDLSFTPEGPISQPDPPPVAAVLPCRHTFHSDCLERITPEDLSKDPPCIPCALRE